MPVVVPGPDLFFFSFDIFQTVAMMTELGCSAPRNKDEKCMSPEHEDCSVTDELNLVCKEGTCQAIECTQTKECPASSYCYIPLSASLDPGVTHCERMLGYGEACVRDDGCVGNLVCATTEQSTNADDRKCSNRIGEGIQCETNEEDQDLSNCEEGLMCIKWGGEHTVCSAPGKIDQPCLLSDTKTGEGTCDSSTLFCQNGGSGLDGKCEPFGTEDAECYTPWNCAEGFTCKRRSRVGHCQAESKFRSVPSMAGSVVRADAASSAEPSEQDKFERAYKKAFTLEGAYDKAFSLLEGGAGSV